MVGALWTGFDAFAALSARASAYGAIVWAVLGINAFFGVVVVVMAGYALARQWRGCLDRRRRVSFDNVRIFWHYVVVQSLAGTVVIFGFPRLIEP